MSSTLDKVFTTPGQRDWFRPDGATYRMVPDQIRQLPRELWHAATEAWESIMRFLARKELSPLATDQEMAKEAGWSESFLQKGFHALDAKMKELSLPPLIVRERAHGRRQILPGIGLKGDATAKTPSPPPAPPPEDTPDTTTQPGSSSSPCPIGPDPTDRTGPPEARALYERARLLIDGVSLGAIAEAITLFDADTVRRALDWMEKRNRKPGNARKDWGYVFGLMRNRKKTGWPDEPTAAPQPATRPTAATAQDAAADTAREHRLRGLWAALSEGEREAIRAAVKAENPGISRWAPLLEPLYLAELERRQPAEEPRAP